MADHQQRTAVGPQEPHQPLLGVDVQVVRRLVEAKDVAAGEEDAGELDAAPLAAGQHTDGGVDPGRVETEPGGEPSGLAVGGVPAMDPERLLGAGVAGDVAFVGPLLHRDAELLDALELGVDAAPGQDVGDRGAAVEHSGDAGILRQVAERAGVDHATRGRLDLTAQHPEQARLARPVAADQPDLVPGHDGEVGRPDDEPATDLYRESLGLEHRARLAVAPPPSNCGFAGTDARASPHA